MLRSLTVKNFAVISELQIELTAGLNVFTGQTGAGKSILVEALGFLLGARGSLDWLRSGAPRLEVTGVFDAADIPKSIKAQFKITEPQVVLRRELDSSGKTRAYIHNQSVTLSALAELGDGLVDFHGQHEHQTLMKPALQLELLDRFGELLPLRAKVSDTYGRFKQIESELASLQLSDEERLKRIDLYRFQATEVDEVAPKPGEEEDLEAALPRLKNADRLNALSDQVYGILYEQEASVQENLLKAERSLEELSRIDPSLASDLNLLIQARGFVRDVSSRLAGYRSQLDAGTAQVDDILTRLDKIHRLKKKYGQTVADILAYRDRVKSELGWLENSTDRTSELEESLEQTRRELEKKSTELHRERMNAAADLSKRVMIQLKGLGLAQPKFSVSVEMEDGRFSANGADEIDFLIAPNPGEPLKALKSIASGGELSRVMLALKTVLAKNDQVVAMVFDEVDAGIGGEVGRAVGKRLADLGRTHQLLCVTHLPQVACFASNHFHVSKEVSGGRTFTRVENLEGNRRLEIIAQMLGGLEASATSRKHAMELLEASR